MSEDVSTMASDPEEIDLGGDVYVLVGHEGSQIRLKVLSSLLALVSQYFRTLFGSRFNEGEESAQGKDITLQDDDAQAFTLLCRIIHMQYALPKQALGPDELLSLAIVADKYGCVQPLTLTLNSIFPAISSIVTFGDACDLASAAYLLDHPMLFQQLTHSLIYDHANSIMEATSAACGAHIPIHAWCWSQPSRYLANDLG